jgi:dinuclear metal center YbgI/SA1388 family protein
LKISEFLSVLNGIAPWELAEDWDNPGLLVGDPEAEITGALLCVDATPAAVEAAAVRGLNLILAHHPLLFRGTKHLRTDDYEGALLTRLLRSGTALVAAHTNLDRAPGGVNDCLAAALGMQVEQREDYLRVGTPAVETAGALADWVRERINPQAVFYGDRERRIDRIAASCGAGGEFCREAARLGAQVFVTGEMKHNERIEAEGLGMCVLLAGHGESEAVVLEPLRAQLASHLRAEVFAPQRPCAAR